MTLFANALIHDGLGNPPYLGELLMGGGRIISVRPKLWAEADHVIDLQGRVLAPGFIDLHRHIDMRALDGAWDDAELRQGITTAFGGACGLSAFPASADTRDAYAAFLEPCLGASRGGMADTLADALVRMDAVASAINVGFLVGLGATIASVAGLGAPSLGDEDAGRVRDAIDAALSDGAFGVSIGLMYAPECTQSAANLAYMLAPLRGRGLLTCHLRGEGDLLLRSIDEAIALARDVGVPLHISHLKALGPRNWRRAIPQAIERIESARAGGQDVTADAYPYAAGATTMLSLLPPEYLAGGIDAAIARTSSHADRARLAEAMHARREDWDNAYESLGPERIVLSGASSDAYAPYAGRSLADIADDRGVAPVDLICDVLAAENGRAGILLHSMSEADVDDIARLDWTLPISDALYGPTPMPHPRRYGAFARYLRTYAVDRSELGFAEAIRRMTSVPAGRMGLTRRGAIAPGLCADLVAFYPDRFRDVATYDDPARVARGMDYVVVNGELAIEAGELRSLGNGRTLCYTTGGRVREPALGPGKGWVPT